MIDFSSLLHPSCVLVDAEAADKDSLLRSLTELLHASGTVTDPDLLLHDLLEREKLVSTGVGEGIAIPHALSDAVTRTVMAVCRLKRPVDFASLDDVPVTIVVLIAGPRDATGMHLQILAKVARLFHDSAFRSAFEDAPAAETLASLFYGS
jgi:PTS system fructose-specific IIC component/PTS system nitrogen regulatory IIA component